MMQESGEMILVQGYRPQREMPMDEIIDQWTRYIGEIVMDPGMEFDFVLKWRRISEDPVRRQQISCGNNVKML